MDDWDKVQIAVEEVAKNNEFHFEKDDDTFSIREEGE